MGNNNAINNLFLSDNEEINVLNVSICHVIAWAQATKDRKTPIMITQFKDALKRGKPIDNDMSWFDLLRDLLFEHIDSFMYYKQSSDLPTSQDSLNAEQMYEMAIINLAAYYMNIYRARDKFIKAPYSLELETNPLLYPMLISDNTFKYQELIENYTKEVFKFFEFPEKKDGKEIVTPTEILDGFPYIQGWRMATEPDLENDEDVFGSAFLCMSNARFYPLEELPTYCNYISIILKDLEKYTETFKSCKDIHDTIVNNEVNSDPVFLYEYAVQYLKQYIRLMLRVIKSFVKEGTYILDFIPEELNLLMDKALYFESAFRKIISNYPQKTFVFSECIAD